MADPKSSTDNLNTIRQHSAEPHLHGASISMLGAWLQGGKNKTEKGQKQNNKNQTHDHH